MKRGKEMAGCGAEAELREKAAGEHEAFKKDVLSLPKETLYDACGRIGFYECLHEYFQYSGRIHPEAVQIFRECETPIALLWEFYLQREELRADTWEGIEEMLRLLAQDEKRRITGI